MEGRVDIPPDTGRPWQADLCQFFTRENVAELCLRHVTFPKNLLSMRLLEPAAGQGAFFLPLVARLIRSCQRQEESFDVLRPIIRAYEIDAQVAATLRLETETTLETLRVDGSTARSIARDWVRNEDFLEATPRTRFTHIVGNPPYIRWDAIPSALRESYKARFTSFKQRADLYVAFIEHALSLLEPRGQLGFLCPGTWTRNVYGGAVRETFTTLGQLKTIIDFSDAESFETSADTYPHFFVFQKGVNGPTRIRSMAGSKKIGPSGRSVVRTFLPSASPLFLSRNEAATKVVSAARMRFSKIEDAGCTIRVGSATGCNEVCLGSRQALPVERSRLLPFVNAHSISKGKVHWTGTYVVNVFDGHGKVVTLARFPRMAAYLRENQKQLRGRAKASKSKTWWRSIDSLHPDWYAARKLLVIDISAAPVIGLDSVGYCAGSGVYQIKSRSWPLADLHVFLSAGVLGLFVSALSAGAANGFHRFQKSQIAAVHIPKWTLLDAGWKKEFRAARRAKQGDAILKLVAEQYDCEPSLLASHIARDWPHLWSKASVK
jgi:adenine-specific DNA-methyltransferase